MLHIDLALEWMQVNSGQVIFNEGDQADNIYICIQGRLRGINEKSDGSIDVRGEFGQGDSVGELECLTSTARPWTLHAIRDTEMVRMPAQLFNAIAVRHPSITVHMTQLLASKIQSEMLTKNKLSLPPSPQNAGAGNVNLKVSLCHDSTKVGKAGLTACLQTVAILPMTQHIP